MALRDLEAFMRERAAVYDPSMDATVGSPFDVKVIQPLLRREGIDPFSVDLTTFMVTRLKQAYPKMALDEGDNLVDIIIKANSLLWDPLVRETTRVKRNQSFQDPTSLTTEEADSLGGNFFTPRKRGQYSRGPARIYFATPSNQSITQNNFVTSNGGLIYFPTELQSIRAEEMNLNVTDGNLYYFDINVIAENPGAAYDIGPNEVVSIANMPAAIRVSNTRRFKFGDDEENVVEYVNRLQQSLGEKSMVTLRGIAAKLLEGFPEINRLNVVGFNDPEMKRDVVTGGGLGPILATGRLGRVISDGENKAYSRRFSTVETDFGPLVGRGSLVLTLVGPSTPAADYDVLAFRGTDPLSNSVLDLQQQVLVYGDTGMMWFLRRRELTLSGIPGGILFPDSSNGTVALPDGQVHIGGADDIHLRTSSFDEATFTVANVSDEQPLLSGISGFVSTGAGPGILKFFTELVLGTDYQVGDATDQMLDEAAYRGYSLQIQEGPNAGTYRILMRASLPALNAGFIVDPPLVVADVGPLRWRLFDEINISLNEPKDVKVTGTDLVLTQGSNLIHTAGYLDFRDFGVSKGDVLRVLSGEEIGDYNIVDDPLVPNGDRLRIEVEIPRSWSNIQYTIFRANDGAISTPLVRVRSVELLDSSSQPQGSFIPYACPVDVQSRAFQNPARGVKHDLNDGEMGIISQELTFPMTFSASDNVLAMNFGTLVGTRNVTITPGTYIDRAALISELNTQSLAMTSAVYAELFVAVAANRVGVRPAGNGYISVVNGTNSAIFSLFGSLDTRTTADIRSAAVNAAGGWAALSPSVDYVTGLDVFQVIGGSNSGFIDGPFYISVALIAAENSAALLAGEGFYFSPEFDRDILIGSRSLGSARVYFLEPTSFEVDSNSVFELNLGSAGIVRFIPDPTLTYQQIPAQPNGLIPVDGSSTQSGSTFTSTSQDFLVSGIKANDRLVIDFFPIYGDVLPSGLTNPVVDLVGKTFIYSMNNGADHVLTFIRNDTSLPTTDVGRDSVADQINAAVGLEVAAIEETTPGIFNLVIRNTLEFVVRKEGTANDLILYQRGGMAAPIPPLFSDEDQDNVSPHAGIYTVQAVTGINSLSLDSTFPADADWPATISEQSFKVERVGVQRISTTSMSENKAEAGLYYFDVELVSEGAGDFWNIAADQQMTVNGYRSDGYRLVTEDENLTFSDVERVQMVISRTILEQGVDDDPSNATQVTGQNLQVTYEWSSTVKNVQDYAQSEVERVVCSSPLARHLIPHFIRFDMIYAGGSKESVVVPDVEKYISGLYPADTLDSSDLQAIITGRGATYVQNPINLIAVVHKVDRTIYIQRSQDRLSTGRLAAFIPDVLNISRTVGTT